MTEASTKLPDGVDRPGFAISELPVWSQFLLVFLVGSVLGLLVPAAARWPEEWILPAEPWLTSYIEWLKSEATVFGIEFKEITRGIGDALKVPVKWAEYALYRGFKGIGLGPLPWVAVVAGVVIFAHWVGGWRLALLCLFSLLYIAFFNLWKDSMRTMTIVIVAVPMAAIIGVLLGILVTRSRIAARIFTPMFDLMQATPHMAYLAPVAALFALGPVTALIATVIFAMPPMARCTILGLQTVSSDVLESGQMSGCTRRQLLWKVALPSSKRTLMLGLNQVVMQTLAMVVIASIAGAQGLGHKLLYSLQQLRLGVAIEQGIAISLIAIVLDRITQGYANRETDHFATERPWHERHRHLLIFLPILVGSYILAEFFKDVRIPPSKWIWVSGEVKTVLFDAKQIARVLDQAIRDFNVVAFDYVNPVRDWATLYILLPIRDVFLWLPWPAFFGVVGLAAWKLGRWKIMVLCLALMASFTVTGFWEETMKTTYLVLVATILCILIGVPLGIWSARSERVANTVMPICDTLQTFPSFIYLIPAIMLFRIGDFANVFAIIPYAMVPAIRFTYLGLKRIPAVTVEAAMASGATRWQRLWKVELPIAIPEMMLGINQTIMMALAMTAITALIGSTDLGQEVVRSISTQNFGRGILAGLFIAALGIIGDRIIGAWAEARKKQLGIA
ncbi:MAG: ABC transporter permease subunit [Pseudomonadota bacterium]